MRNYETLVECSSHGVIYLLEGNAAHLKMLTTSIWKGEEYFKKSILS